MVPSVSTVPGAIGVVSAFGLFYLGERVFYRDRTRTQAMLYLKLSVAANLITFLTRTHVRSDRLDRRDSCGSPCWARGS